MALFQRQDYESYQMQPGDLIRFDFEGRTSRYWTDLGRTCSIGEPSAKAKQYYQAMLVGREAAMEAMRPGASASEVCRIARRGDPEERLPGLRHRQGPVHVPRDRPRAL